MGEKAWFGFSLLTPWKTREKVFFPVWPVLVTSHGFYSDTLETEEFIIIVNCRKEIFFGGPRGAGLPVIWTWSLKLEHWWLHWYIALLVGIFLVSTFFKMTQAIILVEVHAHKLECSKEPPPSQSREKSRLIMMKLSILLISRLPIYASQFISWITRETVTFQSQCSLWKFLPKYSCYTKKTQQKDTWIKSSIGLESLMCLSNGEK